MRLTSVDVDRNTVIGCPDRENVRIPASSVREISQSQRQVTAISDNWTGMIMERSARQFRLANGEQKASWRSLMSTPGVTGKINIMPASI